MILSALNGIFEGDATGETFVKKGKTDIHLKIEKGEILIFECKNWGGEKIYLDTIDQLMGYVTWRQNYGVVIMFSKNKVFSKTLAQIPDMVVTKSRLHAVRYKIAFDKYLKEKGYGHKALVAFSGTVKDVDTKLEYTEGQMNKVPESQTAEEFKNDDHKFLIVAEKFQTGFDQPLLSVMYVDKKLGGVSAVQTLSRLNRTTYGKDDTFVLDFVNQTDDIKEAFQPYYTTTVLSEATEEAFSVMPRKGHFQSF